MRLVRNMLPVFACPTSLTLSILRKAINRAFGYSMFYRVLEESVQQL